MKINITKNIKLWLIITLAVLAVGMLVLGVFGMNDTVDYKTSYEVHVGIDQNLNGSGDFVNETAKSYFTSVGAKVSSFSTQVADDGATYIYKLNSIDKVVKEDLSKKVKEAIAASDYSELTGSVDVYETEVYTPAKEGLYVVLALGIAVVVIFLYVLAAEKLASSVAVLCSSVLSALIFVALTAIVRLPLISTFTTFGAVAACLGAVYSVAMCNRFRETSRLVAEQKLTANEIADKGASMSFARFNFTLCGVAAAGIALVVGGIITSLNLAIIGAQLILAGVSAYYSAFVATPIVWSAIKGGKAKK